MGAGHAALYRDGASAVHRAPAEAKIVALVVFVGAVVAAPRDVLWPYACFALVVAVVWRVAAVPPRWALPRMLIEVPFVVLALLLPFGPGTPRIELAGAALSVPGLWAAWGIVAKGTLGVAASLTVAATTSAREVPTALSRLGLPALPAAVLVLMLRYGEVLVAETARMRLARLSRGDAPRALHQVGATARGLGALFLRAHARGERVHLAMVSRGYDGRLADVGAGPRPSVRRWAAVVAPGLVAVAVTATAWIVR